MNKREQKVIDFLNGMCEKFQLSGCPLTFTQWLVYYNYYEAALSFDYKNVDYVKYGNVLLKHVPFCAKTEEEYLLTEKRMTLLELLEDKRLISSLKKKR